jgi:membrane-bound lytic murein transglycosylase D
MNIFCLNRFNLIIFNRNIRIMKNTFLIIAIGLLSTMNGFPQSAPDTLLSPIHLIDNTDSLEVPNDTLPVSQYLNIPDSIYMKRLSALPFEFEMTYNPVVKRYIELYTVKIRNKLKIIIGLSNFYFPIFEEVLNAYQLPDELKYIPIIESALNPRAVSRARAVGLWQFMKGTGKENGLTINSYVDERRGLTESTKAAAKYLKRLYNTYNDWQLVLAAYNCGPGNVNRAIHRSGGKRDFWEIYRYLPRETRGYVPEYIGAAYAFNYYKEHSIDPVPAAFPPQIDTIMIFKNLHLKQVSDVLGMNIAVLRMINPQYIKDIIPANGKTVYLLNIPLEQKLRFHELKDSIYAYHSSFYKNEIRKQSNLSYTSHSGNRTKITHHVKSGESIWLIAGQYKVTVNNIKEWNNISGSTIRQGQKLTVYVPKNGRNVNL